MRGTMRGELRGTTAAEDGGATLPGLIAQFLVEDKRGLSNPVSGFLLSRIYSLNAGAAIAAVRPSHAAAGGRHFQAADRDQHDRLGRQRNRGLRSDGEAFSRRRIPR